MLFYRYTIKLNWWFGYVHWFWVQAIRSYLQEIDPEQVRSEKGAGAGDIAEVVSDVTERLPDLASPPQLESPEQARFQFFDSIIAHGG